jgi:hypothetical protein
LTIKMTDNKFLATIFKKQNSKKAEQLILDF